MFEALTDKFNAIFKKLRSKGKLSEEDVDAILKELEDGTTGIRCPLSSS